MRAGQGTALAVPFVALLFLVGCGGGQSGPLTTQEYADALVETQAEAVQQAEKLNEEHLEAFGDLIADHEEELAAIEGPVEAGRSWSEDTAEAVSEFARLLWEVQADVFSGFIQVLEDYHDAISQLKPPDHLSDLHETMTAAITDGIGVLRSAAEEMEGIETSMSTAVDFVEFSRGLNSSLSDLEGLGGDEFQIACGEMQARLETELGGNVEFTCN